MNQSNGYTKLDSKKIVFKFQSRLWLPYIPHCNAPYTDINWNDPILFYVSNNF